MASPFPGMDPYLESHWGDVHARAVIYAADHLQRVLPRDLRARVEERLVVAGLERPRPIYPDVRVLERSGKSRRIANGPVAVATAEPLVIELPDEAETQAFIEIRERSLDSRLVTVIEMLSPSNKTPGPGQEQYLQKQHEVLEAGVSLVEIDLLREGDWILALARDWIEPAVQTCYGVVVRRGWRRTRAEYYPIALRQQLPTIKVPLRQTDTDVPLDLQALLDQTYENGGYDDIDYTVDPQPPLHASDARWVDRVLRHTGLRGRRKARKKT